ncbi:MAG: sodium:calcium antiporter, partial [Lachnospiraceae bacterium]|nr:sodium:calcium antiporter [Candidatus Equihabitans merdae]
TLFVDLPFSGICALLLVLLGAFGIGAGEKMTLGRLGGIIMLLLFAGYLVMMLKRVKMHREAANEDAREDAVATAITEETDVEENRELMPIGISLLRIVGGAAAIAFGGNLTVETASRIATDFGMSQTLVGLTIVSIGTSLPELVTSIVAARKNEIGMALGNAIGSNIFNILMVLGIASAVSPIALIGENIIDVIVLLVFSAIVWFLAYTRRKVDKKEGLLMLALYLAFAIYICIR